MIASLMLLRDIIGHRRLTTLISLAIARENGADAYKVHTTDMENKDFIRAVVEVGKPVLFATGGVHEDALADALATVGDRDLGLLFGFQTFPTPVEEIRFRELESLKSRYQVPVGFLDHTDGGTLFALLAPALSVSYGADLVEKHFTLERDLPGPDHKASLEPGELRSFAERLKAAAAALGSAEKRPGLEERQTAALVRRSWHATRDLPAGTRLAATDVVLKRPALGLAPGEAIIGRRLKIAVAADAPIHATALSET